MEKEKWWIRLFCKIGLIKQIPVSKEEMCKKAVDSGVCTHSCGCCAWNTAKEVD